MAFITHYNYEPIKGAKVSDELIAEQTGFQSNKQIIEGMMQAGERLENYRHGLLDNYEEYESDEEEYREEDREPSQRYDMDPVDLQTEILRMRFRTPKDEVIDEREAPKVELTVQKQGELIPGQNEVHTDD